MATRIIRKTVTIRGTELKAYNDLKAQGYTTLWVGNGLMCLEEPAPVERSIYLPAIDKRVSLGAYVKAVKAALANPAVEFKHGLTCWWPCKGSEIGRQFLAGVHDRINQSVPYLLRGK